MKKSNKFSLFTILFFLITVSCTNKNNDILPDGGSVSTVTDIDGNVYKTVKIGTQTWMAENLKTTKFNDGLVVPLITSNAAWSALTTPAYCWYNNDLANYKVSYGGLYNWYAVNSGRLAPKGWHVASDQDWVMLENFVSNNLGNSPSQGKALAADYSWEYDNSLNVIGNDLTKNNSSGFGALPGGCRALSDGSFSIISYAGHWWTITESNNTTAWGHYAYNGYTTFGRYNFNKQSGLSVRCIKD